MHSYHVVNVFSEKGILGGNPLGVVLDAHDLTSEEMLAIARQFNYSESTFVLNRDEKGGEVKIFLPVGEIAFAGHPTIGTGFVLEMLWREVGNPGRSSIRLVLKKGPIELQVMTGEDGDVGVLWMEQFPVSPMGEFEDRKRLAEVLGVSSSFFLDLPLLMVSPGTIPFLFVPLREPSMLAELSPDFEAMKGLLGDLQAEPYVFSMKGLDGGDVRARFFAPFSGVLEDPATGSAQAALSHYLVSTGLISVEQEEIEFVVEQGYEMGRPSKLHNRVFFVNGRLGRVMTGGRCFHVAKGVLSV